MILNVLLTLFVLSEVADYGYLLLLQRVDRVAAERFEKKLCPAFNILAWS